MATNEKWWHLYFLVDSLGESYEKAIESRKSLVGDCTDKSDQGGNKTTVSFLKATYSKERRHLY